jgi:protein-S-isoprenylcysteine O-methyltransferase Ste14
MELSVNRTTNANGADAAGAIQYVREDFMTEALRVFLAVLAFGAVHSLLAADASKAAARKRFGVPADQVYRLFYNAVAILTLIPLAAVTAGNLGSVVYAVPMPWAAVMAAGAIAGFLLLGVSFLQSDPAYFAGFRQMIREDSEAHLVTTRAYGIVRHPIYSTALLVLWCLPVQTTGSLALGIGITLYVLIGSELEERRLIVQFGGEYLRYRSKVARLIPFLF